MIQTDSTAEPQFAAFVAIDWADQKHAWSLQAAGSDQREADEMKHTPPACGLDYNGAETFSTLLPTGHRCRYEYRHGTLRACTTDPENTPKAYRLKAVEPGDGY